ncbi:MAG: translesion error-prone DNA polymerase V autoproteolytic subunit [Bacteroidota bacterium]
MTANILNLPERYTTVERIYFPRIGKTLKLPLFFVPVSAGFPSPADDYSEETFDFNEQFLKNPPSSFVVKVTGDSMVNAGIYAGDSLVVDMSLTPQDGDIVIAVIHGEYILKRLLKTKGKVFLCPENTGYKPIEITESMEAVIWGVVSSVHRSLKG